MRKPSPGRAGPATTSSTPLLAHDIGAGEAAQLRVRSFWRHNKGASVLFESDQRDGVAVLDLSWAAVDIIAARLGWDRLRFEHESDTPAGQLRILHAALGVVS